jgi:hypothetical protein
LKVFAIAKFGLRHYLEHTAKRSSSRATVAVFRFTASINSCSSCRVIAETVIFCSAVVPSG